MGSDEKLAYTYAESAEAAGISPAFVRKLVAEGKLKKIKIGRCARIPRSELQRLCGESTSRGASNDR
jgi:excisionase family DNA binding protein